MRRKAATMLGRRLANAGPPLVMANAVSPFSARRVAEAGLQAMAFERLKVRSAVAGNA